MEQIFAAAFLIGVPAWFVFLAYLDGKSHPRWDGKYEKGQGVVPSAMQNDMMDGGG